MEIEGLLNWNSCLTLRVTLDLTLSCPVVVLFEGSGTVRGFFLSAINPSSDSRMKFQILLLVAAVLAFAGAQEEDFEKSPRFLGLENWFGGGGSGVVPRPGMPGRIPPIGHPGAVVPPRPMGPQIGHPGAVVQPRPGMGMRPGLIRPHARPALVKPIHPQYFGSNLVRPGLIRKPLVKPAIAPVARPSYGGLFSWFG